MDPAGVNAAPGWVAAIPCDDACLRRLRQALASHVGGLPSTFWWLWGGAFLSAVATFVFPFLAVFLTARGLPPAAAGLVVSLFGVGAVVAGPLAGALADRIGRRPTILAALLASAASAVWLAFLSAPPAIAVAVLAFGVTSQSLHAPFMATIADVVPLEHRARAYGLAYWANNVGIGVSLLAGGLLASRGWALPFLLDAATTLLFSAVVFLRVPETRPPSAPARPTVEEPRGFGAVLRDRVFTAFLALHVLFAVAFWQFQTSMPIGMTRQGFSPAAFGAVLAVNTALIALLQPWSAPLLGRLAPGHVLAAAAVLVGAGLGSYAFCRTALHYAAATAVWSLGEIAYMPVASALVAELAPPDLRGRYTGSYGTAFGVSSFVAAALGPATFQAFGAGTLWASCLCACLAAAAGQLLLGRARAAAGHRILAPP